jgi:hypothetical protein
LQAFLGRILRQEEILIEKPLSAAPVYSSFSRTPSKFPNAVKEHLPMIRLLPVGLPALSSIKRLGHPFRDWFAVLILIPDGDA